MITTWTTSQNWKKKNITLARGIYGTFLLFGISYGEKNVLQAKGSASSTNDRGPYWSLK